MAWHMTKHRGPVAVFKEVGLVIACIKPAVEVWRLARGMVHDPGAPGDVKTAMLLGKLLERVFEYSPDRTPPSRASNGSAYVSQVYPRRDVANGHAAGPPRRPHRVGRGIDLDRLRRDGVRRDSHRVQF